MYKRQEEKIAGCNVTVPFKKTVIPFLDRLSPEAKQTQSVNTITYDNGDLVGHNTDIAGFDTAIKKLNFSIKGKKVLILGAGGVVPSGLDGKSLVPVLTGHSRVNHDYVYGVSHNQGIQRRSVFPQRSISDGRYRYIFSFNSSIIFSVLT